MINIAKGMKDVLPSQSYKWQYVEKIARSVARTFGFKEIRTPVLEHTELFLRGVGDSTDIVNKEMYTFLDKGNRSVTLKPEGTAGVARAFAENGMANEGLPAKMYYFSPAFRYERPQAGRLREHHQFGVELYGSGGPQAEAEVLTLVDVFYKRLGLKNVKLQINSIGCAECRKTYTVALKKHFEPHLSKMCADCNSRFEKNPLRILDCKEEGCKRLAANAPRITEYLCDDCRVHFDGVKKLLDASGVEYFVNPLIVRGLDYYDRTVFEFVSDAAGAQGTVCAGGRYDALLQQIGEKPVPAVGFGGGMERLLMVMEAEGTVFPEDEKTRIYVAGMDEKTREKAFEIVSVLRNCGIAAESDLMERSLKAQFKYADKTGAEYVAVIGENELASGEVNLKNMSDGTQKIIKIEDLCAYLKKDGERYGTD